VADAEHLAGDLGEARAEREVIFEIGEADDLGRIEAGRVLLDPRTVLPEEDPLLLRAVQAALAGLGEAKGRPA